ncbi:restriction endonuclease subunit S [Enterococcus faecalis]|uniref:restriction endonuclease subunit S n=1 Tax=Lactococcus lactis TaxID=1358 RepID=UPI001A08827F|nr:restriction endonuclease subunit S [Lactococcus lactis]EGO5060877.1 restriction endonuclease subunit S [Enterococcus faecalis]USI61948.1 restriction endonuclease subunit S [Lactococcus lactis subsp. lactis]
MAKIDDSVKKKVPELRFKGFTDDWEERKLGEFSDVRDGTHASPKYVSQGHPMVTSKNLTHSGLDMTDVSFLTDKDFNEINKRSKVSIGDILFGMIGTIGNPVIVDRDDFAIKNVALIKEKTSNPITNKWLLQYLKSPSFNRFIQKENAGGTQKFIALGLIRDMKLRVPEFDEQQKIGAFFKQIDDTIALHQRKLDLLKEQKKGYLQKMFPKNGAKVPELRFAGFADDWEERKLGQYTKLITKGTTPKDKTGIGDVNFVKVENITNGKIYPINKIKQHEHDNYLKRSRLEEKDILFSIAGTLGRTAIVNKSILPANTNQALAIIRGYDFDTNFLITSLAGNVVKEYIRRNPTVGAQPNLSLEQVGNLLVNTPNAEEQQKIGSFFKQLDDTIALHQRKLDLLKEQKKGFLQKMFV